jgi:bifunctional non-homologous end joining protein LigD
MRLEAIIPFEPVSADSIPSGGQWTAQIKWDGVRMLVYYDGQHTRLVNRKRNDRTMQYPDFADPRRYCSASSVILDGEMVAFDGDKPSFREIMRRDGVRKAEHIAQAVRQVPVTYIVFDVLYADGGWVVSRPLAERQSLLERIVKPQPDVHLARNFADAEALYEVMKRHRMEGIVCKDLTQPYAIGGKDRRWQKLKIYLDLYAVIGGVTHRDGIVNALLLGVYAPDGRLIYIGHAGTGKVTQAEWRALTAVLKPDRIGTKPFANEPERAKEASWVKPRRVVRVQYAELTPNGTLRQPSIQAFVDVSPSECRLEQLSPR